VRSWIYCPLHDKDIVEAAWRKIINYMERWRGKTASRSCFVWSALSSQPIIILYLAYKKRLRFSRSIYAHCVKTCSFGFKGIVCIWSNRSISIFPITFIYHTIYQFIRQHWWFDRMRFGFLCDRLWTVFQFKRWTISIFWIERRFFWIERRFGWRIQILIFDISI